jgi:hypothetical protein
MSCARPTARKPSKVLTAQADYSSGGCQRARRRLRGTTLSSTEWIAYTSDPAAMKETPPPPTLDAAAPRVIFGLFVAQDLPDPSPPRQFSEIVGVPPSGSCQRPQSQRRQRPRKAKIAYTQPP